MGNINYKEIYDKNKHDWFEMTNNPQKYEALLAGHYSERNHFVYELLQNAEDARASKVVIEYYPDKLVFYHNGKPFDTNDVIGVSSMLMGTKDSTDAQTIGRFGMGFKSVFKYTYRPEIYSDDESFRISNYLLPEEVDNGWDFSLEKKNLICKASAGMTISPFEDEKHLTKFVIPFKKMNKKGELEDVNGTEVLLKLRELKGEILLFLSHIQSLYWINKTTGLFSYITVKQDEKDNNMFSCRIEGSNQGEKEEITKYIKFTRVFDHPEMRNAEVSVAYKLNSRGDNINELPGTDICVYFPTREKTDLPFLIHGSFETAVSREKLMTPSTFNNDLLDVLGSLIADTLPILAERRLLTQSFIRNLIIPTFGDEEKNNTIPRIIEKITEVFSKEKIIPTSDGDYRFASECHIPLPFQISYFIDASPFDETLNGLHFVDINNANQANFQSYFTWLYSDLEIPMFTLRDWAKNFDCLEGVCIDLGTDEFENLKKFYDLLSDHKESVYLDSLSYFRKGNYEREIKNIIEEAWNELRVKPVVLNQEMELVPAFVDEDPRIYLRASSELRSIVPGNLVSDSIEQFARLLRDGFHISEFDDLQYVKEKIINKYIRVDDTIEFENPDNLEEEYISDIKQILSVLSSGLLNQELLTVLKNAYIIKTKPDYEDDTFQLARPIECFLPDTVDGLYMPTYLACIEINKNKFGEDYYNESYILDLPFYEENGISVQNLIKIGVIGTPVIEGPKYERGSGVNYWTAIGDFCPNIEIKGLIENLQFIEENPGRPICRDKSSDILRFLLNIAEKLRGQRSYRKNNSYLGNLEPSSLYRRILKYKWLYDSDEQLHYIFEISRYEINQDIYGHIHASDKEYQLLGFAEKEIDTVETTFRRVDELDEVGQRKLLKSLAKKFGMELSEAPKKEDDDWEDEDNFFNPNEIEDSGFPLRPVRNMEYLKRHVYEQFYCADPVKYEKVLRKIRTSKSPQNNRAYVEGMYVNSNNHCICQMCEKVTRFHETIQIANYGIEMPQFNLCLCRECAAVYKSFCLGHKEDYKELLKNMIYDLNIELNDNSFTIELDSETALHFTQTHIAELQEIFFLLDKYGLPRQETYEDDGNDETEELQDSLNNDRDRNKRILEPIIPTIVEEVDAKELDSMSNETDDIAKEGSFVSYKRVGAYNEISNNILDPKRYPLHQSLEGHRPGDVVLFFGKKYELISVIND